MTKKSFEEHVQELWDYYKPVMDGIPTPDQIFQGASLPERDSLSHDQMMNLVNSMNDELALRYKEIGDNILFDSYLDEYINFLNWINTPEIVIMSIRLSMKNRITPIGEKLTNLNHYNLLEILLC